METNIEHMLDLKAWKTSNGGYNGLFDILQRMDKAEYLNQDSSMRFSLDWCLNETDDDSTAFIQNQYKDVLQAKSKICFREQRNICQIASLKPNYWKRFLSFFHTYFSGH